MNKKKMIVSQRDLNRMHVVRLTLEGRESVERAAELLGLSARQIKRMRKKMRAGGAKGMLHGNRGRKSWNRTATKTWTAPLQLESFHRDLRGARSAVLVC
jgi:transposase-like protein